ncbi:MAG: hypothetical protein Alpg2KO_13410 [Alphaproteobacteria bacterium]
MARAIDTPARRIFLTLGAEGAVLCVVTPSGEIKEAQWSFSREPEALSGLATWLKSRRKRPIHLLIDLAEIKLRIETVPKATTFDRKRLVARRLDAVYPNAPASAAMPLDTAPIGFEAELAEGRLPYLLAALPESAEWAAWAEWLAGLPNPIGSIRFLPIEQSSMVHRLSHLLELDGEEAPPWTLYLAPHRSGGMRQVVVTASGTYAMTRLTPLSDPEGTLQDVAADVRDEIAATISYLSRIGYEPGDGLDVIVCADAALEPVLTELPIGRGRLRVIEAGKAGKMLRLRGTAFENDDDADLLAAAWAASRPRPALSLPTENLIPARRENLRVAQLRKLLWGACIVMGVAALALTGVIWMDRETRGGLVQDVEIARAQASQITSELDQLAPNGVAEPLSIARRFGAPQVDVDALLVRLAADMPSDLLAQRVSWVQDDRKPDLWQLDVDLDLSGYETRLEARETVTALITAWQDAMPDLSFVQRSGPLLASPDQRFTGQIGGVQRNPWAGAARRAVIEIMPRPEQAGGER